MNELAAAPLARLAALEEVIAEGLATFVAVGEALREICDERLYLATHGSFEEYVRDRWGIGRQYAYRQMQAAEVAAIVSPTGDAPATERQARELAPLRDDPNELRDTFSELRDEHGDALTAADVREAVQGKLASRPPAAGTGEVEQAREELATRQRARRDFPRAGVERKTWRDVRGRLERAERELEAARRPGLSAWSIAGQLELAADTLTKASRDLHALAAFVKDRTG